MSLDDHNQNIYFQLLELQKTIMESQQKNHEEFNSLRKAIAERLAPLEDKVGKHELVFSHTAKVITWVVPSGTMLGLIGWFMGFFGHR